MSTWFVLGREPLLSYAELAAVFGFADGVGEYAPPLYLTDETYDDAFMNELGGVIKMGREVARAVTTEQLEPFLRSYLAAKEGRALFGLSVYVHPNAPSAARSRIALPWVVTLGKRLKQALRDEGVSARYVLNESIALSSASVANNKLVGKGVEFLLFLDRDGTWRVGITSAVQPFAAWSDRDYGRPGRDDLSGMLPPKLALMMINLAGSAKDEVLLDPFCGSGTIITEALRVGYTRLIGSDVSVKAVEDAARNVEWFLKKHADISVRPELAVRDVRSLSEHIAPGSIGAVVTEPFLGKPKRGREARVELEAEMKMLSVLYAEALAVMYKLLKPSGRLVMIVPRFEAPGGAVRMTSFMENAKRIGFKLDPVVQNAERLVYARSEQRVAREIWRLRKV